MDKISTAQLWAEAKPVSGRILLEKQVEMEISDVAGN